MIEIKLTCETVAEAQAEMAVLLLGHPTIISGLERKAIVPVRDLPLTSPAVSNALSGAELSESSPVNTPMASTEAPLEPSSGSTTEPPKRGRGRPRKDTAPVAAETPPAGSEGNAPSGEASATETAEPTSDAASSTSSESAPQVLATEQATAPADVGNAPASAATGPSSAPANLAADSSTAGGGQNATTGASPSESTVTDTELQRFCARLAQYYGGPQKIFEMAGAFLPEGTLARPTNIMGNDKRWEFIRAAEADSGLTYHG